MAQKSEDKKLKEILRQIKEQKQPKSREEFQKWFLKQFQHDEGTEAQKEDRSSFEIFALYYLKKIHFLLENHRTTASNIKEPSDCHNTLSSKAKEKALSVKTCNEIQSGKASRNELNTGRGAAGDSSTLASAPHKSYNESYISERSYESFSFNCTQTSDRTQDSLCKTNVSLDCSHCYSHSYTMQSNTSTPGKPHHRQTNYQNQNQHQHYHQQKHQQHSQSYLPTYKQQQQYSYQHQQPQHYHQHSPQNTSQTPQSNHSYQRRSTSSNDFNTNVSSTPTSGSNHHHHRRAIDGSGGNSSNFCLGDFIVNSPALNNRLTKKKARNSNSQSSETATNSDKPKKRVQLKTVKRSLNVTDKNLAPTLISSNASPSTSKGDETGCNLSVANLSISDKPTATGAELSFPPESPPVLNVSANSPVSVVAEPMKFESELKSEAKEIELEQNLLKLEVVGPVSSDLLKVATENIQEEQDEKLENAVIPETTVDMSTVTHKELLQSLALIYSILLDMNLSVDILQEIALLLSLLNLNEIKIPGEPAPQGVIDSSDLLNEMCLAFKPLPNALFFTFCVLHYQKSLLAVLDVKSLTAILQIEGIMLAAELKQFVEDLIQHKNLLLKKSSSFTNNSFSVRPSTTSFNTVYFQEETDSREYFPNYSDFYLYRSQRDLFYDTLKVWENKQLASSEQCKLKLAKNIIYIFKQSENLINMTHFAHLFVSQLVSSALEAATPEEIGLKLDSEKLKHLMQRFIVPSTFSSDYQFPRSMEFFKEFITIARSTPFGEQLKLALFMQLITLNDSPMEQYNLIATENDYEDNFTARDSTDELIVRPDVLASMLVLAKFLGFIMALPYKVDTSASDENNSTLPPSIEKQQIELRSVFAPPFDVAHILKDAIEKKKVLITLPWLVQYLGMLDNVSLQLKHTSEALRTVFEIYINLDHMENHGLILPTSAFIRRCCVGWLLAKNSLISELYFSFRASSEYVFKKSTLSFENARRRRKQSGSDVVEKKKITCEEIISKLHPSLEQLINVACPFLQEFRVTIKPPVISRATKSRSLTTTVFNHTTKKTLQAAVSTEDEKQDKLIKSFLQSQSASNRTMVEYIIDRAFKATVRDAQLKILVPSKNRADEEVNQITSTTPDHVLAMVEDICKRAQQEAFEKWDNFVPKDLEKRINQALDALLPSETVAVVKKTFLHLIRKEATRKAYQWRRENLEQNNFYYQNIYDMSLKIAGMNSHQKPIPTNTTLKMNAENLSVSDLLVDLQLWLHCATVRPEDFKDTRELIQLVNKFKSAFENVLPPIFYRIVGSYLLELLQRILANHTSQLTKDLIKAACDLWNHPRMLPQHKHEKKAFGKGGPPSSRPFHRSTETPSTSSQASDRSLGSIFDILININFIKTLGTSKACYAKLTEFLIILIQEDLVTIDFVNTLFMSIFKENLSPEVLNLISNMLQTISIESTAFKGTDHYDENLGTDEYFDETKSRLLMEALADLSRDVDILD